jgi:glycerophosphoryl diester phosphodiesterase
VRHLSGEPRPLRFAHRGASTRAPENTLAAFEEAIRLGVDAIELDVHLSADGVPVVIHDETVDRTTDGRGAVASLPLAALKRLDAGAWFSPQFRGERIPTLEEAFDRARGRCGLNIEIKERKAVARNPPGGRGAGARPASPATAVALAIARARERSGFDDLMIVSSFSAPALLQARAAIPQARLGFLVSRSAAGLASLHRRVGLHALHPHHRLATPGRIRLAHRLGLSVFVWPVNGAALMRRLVVLGADGLMTDDPALFQSLWPDRR